MEVDPSRALVEQTGQRASRTWSLRLLLVLIAVALTLPPTLFDAYLLQRYADGERDRAADQLGDHARGTANLLDAKFAEAIGALRVLAASPQLEGTDLSGFETLLRRVSESTGRPLFLIDPEGRQLVNTLLPAGEPSPARSDVSRWRPALDERIPFVTNVYRGPVSNQLTVGVVLPVVRDNSVRFTLSTALYPKDFADILAAPGVPTNWFVSIVDRTGTHIGRSHRNDEFAGRQLSPDLLEQLRRSDTGPHRATTLEGVPVISAIARAGNSGWAVAIGLPIADLDQPASQQLFRLMLGGLGVIAIGIAIASLLGREIDVTVRNLTAQAAALAAGRPVVAKPSTVREAQAVNQSLAAAAGVLHAREQSLRELNAHLEQQVAERTAELRAANDELQAEMKRRAESEQNFSVLVQGVADYALYLLDPDGKIATWNVGAERLTEFTEAEAVGRHFEEFYPEEDRAAGAPRHALEVAAREGRFEKEGWRLRKNGERFWAHAVLDAIRNDAGELVGFAKITRDVTELRRAEDELRRAQADLAQVQKMEATGQLTGGVAHDFNNILAVILAGVQLLQDRMRRGEDVRQFIEGIRDAAERGATLTKRLLAFARRQPLAPETVDVNALVSDMSVIFRRTIPENIAIEQVLADGLWTTHVDRNALENALLNLVTNARDAMPEGGRVTIETANADLDDDYTSGHADVAAGQYVMVAVSDTGSGMPRDVVERAFEPFFTTKPTGQGTGLGLSQVYGFTKQSGGHATIYSEAGHGTTVKLYLPRLHGPAHPTAPVPRTGSGIEPARSGELILVVEDDARLRRMVLEMLAELGYRTVAVSAPSEALAVLREQRVDLLLTDIVMPQMSGPALAEAARREHPGLQVLFMTGYTQTSVLHSGIVDPHVALLVKPFSLEALSQKLFHLLAPD